MSTDTAFPEPLVYSIKDACRISSLGRTTIHGLIKTGVIKATRVGSRTLVNAASLKSLVAAND